MPINPSVFVSFSFADRPMAELVVARLKEQGIDAWLCTEELRSGGTFDAQIQEAITSCDYGLFLLSPSSAVSEECHAEWRYMLGQTGHRFYMAQLVETSRAAVSYRLRIYQFADLTQDFESGIESLAHSIKEHRDLDSTDSTTRRKIKFTGEVPGWQLLLPMVGRDEIMQHLRHGLTAEGRVLLTGAGGVGKTKLAVELATSTDFVDGMVWFRIPPADSNAQATADLAKLTDLLRQHFQLADNSDESTVWTCLGQTSVLLVLDNAEDCQYPEPYVECLNRLPGRSNAAVLVTSRYDWPGLRHFTTNSLNVPSHTDAVRILQRLAVQNTIPHPLSDADASMIAEAAHDNPRLLTAASPLLKSYPAQQVATQLRALRGRAIEDAVQEIIHHTLTLMAQQPSGSAALNALRRLVLCRGGFTFIAAEALLDETVDALDTLRAWSLVRFDGARYSIDALVFAATEPDEAAYPKFFNYYAEQVLQLNNIQDYATSAAELENLKVAIAWALRANHVENAFGLVIEAGEMLHNRGRYNQELTWLQQVETALPDDASGKMRATIANCWGRYYLRQPLGNEREHIRAAVNAFEQALTFYQPSTDPLGYAAVKGNLGGAYWRWSQLEAPRQYSLMALDALEESLRYGPAAANPLGYATTQDNLGSVYRELARFNDRARNLERSQAAYNEALRYRTPTTAPLDYAYTQNNLGLSYTELADLQDHRANMNRAIVSIQAALVYHTLETAPLAYAMAQFNLATIYGELAQRYPDIREENLKLALTAFDETAKVYLPQQYPARYATTQNNLGALYDEIAKTEDAETYLTLAIAAYKRALEYRNSLDTPLEYSTTLHNLATTYRSLSKLTDRLSNLRIAENLFNQALAFRTKEIVPREYALTRNNLGNLYRDLADATGQRNYLLQSVEAFQEALSVYTLDEFPAGYAQAQYNLGFTYMGLGQVSDAIVCWRAAGIVYQQLGNNNMAADCVGLITDVSR